MSTLRFVWQRCNWAQRWYFGSKTRIGTIDNHFFVITSLLLRIYCLLACIPYPCNKRELLVVVQVRKMTLDLVPRNCYASATVLCNKQMARVSTISAETISMAQILSDESPWQINYVCLYFIAVIKVPKPTAVNLNQVNIKWLALWIIMMQEHVEASEYRYQRFRSLIHFCYFFKVKIRSFNIVFYFFANKIVGIETIFEISYN